MKAPVTIRSAERGDWHELQALLESAHLPIEGAQDHLEHFLVAESGGKVVGGIGLEIHGQHGLLRSMIVDPRLRGQGIASQLVKALLGKAERNNLLSLTLLTETAANYFSRFGFRIISRTEVPESVKKSIEFTSACPMSATVMVFTLGITSHRSQPWN